MKFKAVMPQKNLRSLLTVLTETVDEAGLVVSPTGIKIGCIDPSSVLMTNVSIPAEAWEYYESESGEIGLDLGRLLEMISSGEASDSVSLELGDKLLIRVGKLEWSMSLLDPISIRPVPKIPDLDLPAMVSLAGQQFRKMVIASEKVADHIRLSMEDETFIMGSKGDIEKVSMKLEPTDLFDIKYGCANSLFMISYMKSISKAAKDVPAMRIEFGQDYPVRISFVLKFETSECLISYLLAPRIEVD